MGTERAVPEPWLIDAARRRVDDFTAQLLPTPADRIVGDGRTSWRFFGLGNVTCDGV